MILSQSGIVFGTIGIIHQNLDYEEKCKIKDLGDGSGRLCIYYVGLQ